MRETKSKLKHTMHCPNVTAELERDHEEISTCKGYAIVACLTARQRGGGPDNRVLNFSGGAGFSVPIEGAGRDLNTGWNLGFRGGYNLSSHWAADLEFGYSHWGLNSAALARYGEPNGSSGIWSLTFNPVYHFAPHSRMNPYVTSGFGLYHRNLTLTRAAVVNTLVCDFFFGFCFPTAVGVNQVVASSSTYKGGYNAGAGIEIPEEANA